MVANDYTVRFRNRFYQLLKPVYPGQRGGKVVIELTIAPSGDITAAHVISSEMHDPEFENKLVARIRLFKFEAKDVAELTATKPIDFFPAG